MRVLLGLGANLGRPEEALNQAIRELGLLPDTCVKAVSRRYITEPIGPEGQPAYHNLAVEIETAFTPLELLHQVKRIEQALGRMPSERWGPRVIDIDLILCEGQCISSAELTVPHPSFRERAFVLVPLAEIAPDAVDPVTGLSVGVLAERSGLAGGILGVCKGEENS